MIVAGVEPLRDACCRFVLDKLERIQAHESYERLSDGSKSAYNFKADCVKNRFNLPKNFFCFSVENCEQTLMQIAGSSPPFVALKSGVRVERLSDARAALVLYFCARDGDNRLKGTRVLK